MANRKISEFAATAVLSAGDYLTLVSAGVNKIITWANAQTEIITDIGMQPLTATAWVIAADANAYTLAYATKLRAAGAKVWVCDGVNDQVQIEAAYTYVGGTVGFGVVQLSEGHFYLDSYASTGDSTYGPCIDLMYPNVWLKGMGMYITTLVVGTHSYNIVDMEADYTTITDLEIDCTNQTSRDYVYCIGTNHGDSGVEYINVFRIYCHDGNDSCRSYGILPYHWNNYVVDHCDVRDFNDDGIHPGSDLANYGCFRGWITNNYVTRCNEGIKARNNSVVYQTAQLIIAHNTCERCGTASGYGYGILVEGRGVHVINNHCNFNIKSGIGCDYLLDGIVMGNTCMNNSRDPNNRTGYGVNWGDGIALFNTCSDVNVEGNMVRDNQATTTDNLTGNVTAGNYVVPVTDGTKFFVYQHVKLHDDSAEEYNWVAGVSGNNVTLELAMANNYTTADNAYLQGVSTQRYGVYGADTCDYLIVTGNNGRGCLTEGIHEGAGANNVEANNIE